MCFSAGWRDPVIWAHYADKHRGICLGFTVRDEHCMPVSYVDDRLPFPAQLQNNDEASLQHLTVLLSTKFGNWRYENEIRLWVNIKDRENGLYYQDFDEELRLDEVIAGARCTVPKIEIERAIRGLTYPVTIIKARAGFERFDIVEDQRGLK
jgi:hypothetical protein